LAQALADGTLEGEELEIAKANRIIVQESENIKKNRFKKEEKILDSKTRKAVKNG
jgi:fructose-specific phosphotransferase system component IIB